nr:hypothetical protein GCM10020092_070960 [Actinoplanes digitatis]
MLLVGAPLGGVAGGGRFEGEADLDDLLDVVRARQQDAEAAVAVDLDEPCLGEAEQALAGGAAGHAEQVSELVDGVGRAGHELAGGDAVPDGPGDGVGEAVRVRRQGELRHE